MQLAHHVAIGRPESGRMLLLVHGYGSDEQDLAALVPHLDPEGRFLALSPRGPLPVAGTPGYSWYDFGDEGPDVAGFVAAVDALDDLVEERCAALGLDRSKSVFLGFSQGASLVAALGLRTSGRARPAGVALLSGYLADAPGAVLDLTAPDLPPVLVQHGTSDEMVPVELARAGVAELRAAGLDVTAHEYPMGHAVSMESVRDLLVWIDDVLGEGPSAGALAATAASARPAPPPPPAHEPGTVLAVGATTFPGEVLESELPVIAGFWAQWAEPSRALMPVLAAIARMRPGSYKVVAVDIDEAPDVARAVGVEQVPTVVMFRNGRPERKVVGARARPQLEAELGMIVIP